MSRFDEQDRGLIIREIQGRRGNHLNKVGRYSKLLRDGSGTYYCVLGGKEDYFGIGEGIIEEIQEEALESHLIIGVKMKNRIEVYSDEFGLLIESLEDLIYTNRGDYQFHTNRREGRLCIREIEGWCLSLSFEILLSKDKFDELRSEIDELSKDEQQELLDSLRERRNDE